MFPSNIVTFSEKSGVDIHVGTSICSNVKIVKLS